MDSIFKREEDLQQSMRKLIPCTESGLKVRVRVRVGLDLQHSDETRSRLGDVHGMYMGI